MPKLLAGVLAVIAFSASAGWAMDSVEINPVLDRMVESEPGKIVTFSLAIRNKAQGQREFVSEILLPEGWRPLSPEFPFSVPAGQTVVRVMSYFIPHAAAAGEHVITYRVYEQGKPEESDSVDMKVRVLSVTSIELSARPAGQYVLAGDSHEAVFILRNGSNSGRELALKAASSENWPLTAEPSKIVLKPGESREIIVSVKTDPQLSTVARHRITLMAGEPGGAALARTETGVEVIPRKNRQVSPWHELPVRMRVSALGQNDGRNSMGIQAEFSGAGSLDEEGRKRLRFLIRQPDAQRDSVFGEDQEMSVSYETDGYSLHAGDKRYSLSRLTENSFYGRGAQARIEREGASAGVYAAGERGGSGQKEQAVFAALDYWEKKARTGVNVLRKNSDTGGMSTIIGLEQGFTVMEDTRIDLEYAFDGSAPAWQTRLDSYLKGISTQAEFTRAAPGYSGSVSDRQVYSGAVSVPLGEVLRFYANLQESEDNLDLDESLLSAPKERYSTAGIGLNLGGGVDLTVDYLVHCREDRLDQPDFDYREDTVRIRLEKMMPWLTVAARYETGKGTDNITGTGYRPSRYRLETVFRPKDSCSLSSFYEYSDDDDATGEKRQSQNFGSSANVRLGKKTLVTAGYQATDYRQGYEDRQNFEFNVNRQLSGSQSMALRERYVTYRDSERKPENSFLVEYRNMFGVPVARRRTVGAINGVIRDFPEAKPMSGVIVRLNGRPCVTDAKGKYRFAGLVPDIYMLSVDRAGAAKGKITLPATPAKLAVEAGRELEFDMSLTDGCSVAGRILVYRSSSGYNNVAVKGASNTAKIDPGAHCEIRLSNGKTVQIVKTDSSGNFSFEGLPPGSYKLTVPREAVPRYYYAEQESFELTLLPGDSRRLDIRILPIKRVIRVMLEGGTIK